MIFIGWIVFSIIVALLGDDRKIGVWWAFLISIILSPIIGLIVVLCSERKYPQQVIVRNQPPPATLSVAEQLEKIVALKEKGVITEEEFEAQKAKILG